MARLISLQATFNGGELSPRLYGRTDLAKYQSGAELIENFIPRPEGGLQRRHGTRYAGNVKTAANVTRLVPFIFSSTQAYILEFGNLYVRFWKNYGQIISGTPVEVVTPYTTAQLPELSFAQSADTLFIAHPSHPPKTLVRSSDTSWALSDVVQDKGPFGSLNADDTIRVFATITGTNYDPGDTGTMTSSKPMFASTDVGSFLYIEEQYYADKAVYPYGADRANNVNAVVGAQYSNDGKVYECVEAVGGNLSGQIFPTHEIGEAWDSPVGATSRAKFRYLHSRFAIVKITSFTSSTSVGITLMTRFPNGLDPDTKNISGAVAGSTGLVQITSNGHGYGLGDWVLISGVLGTTEANGSWRITNVTTNTFDLEGCTFVNTYIAGGDTAKRYASFKWRRSAFSATRGYPAAVTLHEQRLCWGGTTSEPFGVWLSRAGDYFNHLPGTKDDDAIQYDIAAQQVNQIKWLTSADNLLIGTVGQEFAAHGGGLGDPITPTNTRIIPQSTEGSAGIQPIRAASETLFINRAARKLFALDYGQVGDRYETTDLTELANHLTATGQTFTAMAWARNPASILWVLRSDGVLCSLTYRKDQQVWAWARHPLSDGAIESIAVIPSPDATTDDLWMIVRRTVNGSTVRYVEYLAPPYEPSSATDKTNMAFMDSALSYSGVAVTSLSGLGHLEGKTVKVVVNGALHPDRVVSGGAITLDVAATSAWVGLGYTSKVRTLRPEIPTSVGTVQGRTKRVSRVTVRTLNSLGGSVCTYDESVAEDLPGRDMADLTDSSPPLQSGDFDINLSSDFASDGRIVIKQVDPLPLDILSVMSFVTVSEA